MAARGACGWKHVSRYKKRDHFAHFKGVYFKDTYLQNATCYPNDTWVVYTGGIAAAILQYRYEAFQPYREEDMGFSIT